LQLQGADVVESIENLKEATELYLEEFPMDGGTITPVFEVAVCA
jgi:predicted RNase H-like HicB family nuclease